MDFGMSGTGVIKVCVITVGVMFGVGFGLSTIGIELPLFGYIIIGLIAGAVAIGQQQKWESRQALIKMNRHK